MAVKHVKNKMIYEIQRRFLISNDDFIEILKKENIAYSKDKIRVYYTRISPFCDIKYKKINKNYYQNSYYKLQELLDKKINKITKKEFKKHSKKLINKAIDKIKISFEINGLKFYIYQFRHFLKDLVILKLVFYSFEHAKNFSLPYFIKEYKEITNDEKFYSKNLILYGDFSKVFNAIRCINFLKKQNDIELVFPSQIQSFQAGKILLYTILKSLKKTKDQFVKNPNLYNLEQFCINLDKLNIFFTLFDNFFEINIQTKFQKYFLDLKSQILLDQVDILSLEKYTTLLACDENSKIFFNLEIILRDDSIFFQGLKEQILKRLVAFKLRKELVFLKKKIIKSQTNLEEEFDKIQFLLFYFATMFEEEDIKKLNFYFKHKKLKKILLEPKKMIQKINKSSKILKIYN
ncbi:hypothetical protein [Campylobacter peloridis]|uniref:hypothetical protein n=2 Tax=Campylobacter peloridis TaxID=488546 RepID=UPI001C73A2F4|nr:hypothetical protein [Campylobacter peloridis]